MKTATFLHLISIFSVLSALFCGCTTVEEKKHSPFALAGTLWAPVNGPEGAVLEFTADSGRIVGTTNGNRFFAPIEKAEGNLLNFGSIAITRAMAREPEKEMIFIDALDRTRAWRIDGNTLFLENEHKKVVLKLRRLVVRKKISK
ncbi:MAG: META domain-containing protein [Lentisphaeria bacterium]|nr:META domain-containing protein [Lentisphaeria bacterium]